MFTAWGRTYPRRKALHRKALHRKTLYWKAMKHTGVGPAGRDRGHIALRMS